MGRFLNEGLDTIKEGTRGLIAVSMVVLAAVMIIMSLPVPEWWQACTLIVIGFYFGNRSAENKPPTPPENPPTP